MRQWAEPIIAVRGCCVSGFCGRVLTCAAAVGGAIANGVKGAGLKAASRAWARDAVLR